MCICVLFIHKRGVWNRYYIFSFSFSPYLFFQKVYLFYAKINWVIKAKLQKEFHIYFQFHKCLIYLMSNNLKIPNLVIAIIFTKYFLYFESNLSQYQINLLWIIFLNSACLVLQIQFKFKVCLFFIFLKNEWKEIKRRSDVCYFYLFLLNHKIRNKLLWMQISNK